MEITPFEWKALSFPLIAVDEVGRGCLAGPVVAAALYLDHSLVEFDPRITDSKKISPKKREELAQQISSEYRVSIGQASPQEIDEINIFQASFLAMKRAIEGLKVNGAFVLVDGAYKIPGLKGFEQMALIKGDLRAQPIGAASIVAKVYRDQLMVDACDQYPGYGFEVHKGYATKVHKQALQKLGPTLLHRHSFRGVGDLSGPSH